ncbi:MAG TPA: RNA polymerase sigma factor [Phycisphaerae bacterium]|nr:RNA polymerase sigma factor [Phycisphaerae bacterium]
MALMEAADIAYWFDELARGLALYARQICGAGAEDVVQEVFLRFSGLPRRPDAPRAWLLTAVRHAALDHRRGERRRATRERGAVAREAFETAVSGLESQEVEDALKALALEEREVVTLRIWNGATFEEIAGVTGMPLSTVYHKYRTALETMRARWEAPCRRK